MTTHNLPGRIAKFFLMNKALSILTLMSILFAGIFGYHMMPKQYNPEITLPAFQVSIDYPGATAEEVRDYVTRELEEKVAEIPGVNKISSFSIDGGQSVLRVEFHVGENLEESKIKLLSKIQENLDRRIGNIAQPLIKNITPDNVPILVYTLTSNTLSQNEIRKKALEISHELQPVKGVANIQVYGGERRALKIILDPESLQLWKISAQDIYNVITRNNGRTSVGVLETFNSVHEIDVDAGILTAEKAKEIVVIPGVPLGDIAEVYDGYIKQNSYSKFYLKNSGKNKEISTPDKGGLGATPQLQSGTKENNAIFLGIAKRKGENSNSVANGVFERFEKIMKQEEYSEIQSLLVRDDAQKAQNEINNLGGNLIASICIVAFILFLFLGFRAALIVALSIPLTLMVVFFIGHLFDQTINRITLFALILSLGLLVDSATVVTENIYRHLQTGEKKEKAIPNAVHEIGIGLFLSTITSVIVFLPMTQITGMMGPYMGPLAFFVPAALIVSLLVAYKVIPFLSAYILKSPLVLLTPDLSPGLTKQALEVSDGKNKKERTEEPLEEIDEESISDAKKENNEASPTTGKWRILSQQITAGIKFLTQFNFDSLANSYSRLLKNILKSKWKQNTVLLTLFGMLTLVFMFPIFQLVHFQMLPKSDQNQFFITIDLPEGTNFHKTHQIAEEIKNIVFQHPESISAQVYSGMSPVIDFNGLYRGYADRIKRNQATIKVNLRKAEEERNISTQNIVSEIRKNIRKYYPESNKNIRIRLIEEPPGPPVMATLVAKIKGEKEIQEKITKAIEQKFSQTEGVVDIDTTLEIPAPRTIFSIDHERAKNANIATSDITFALSLATNAQIVSEFHPKDQKEFAFVEVSFPDNDREYLADLTKIYVKNINGDVLPISSFVKKELQKKIPTLMFDEREQTEFITAEMENRSVVYAAIDMIFKLYNSPPIEGLTQTSWNLFGFTYEDEKGKEYKLEWDGEWKMTLENFRDLGIAMGIAFFLVYTVLVIQFQSFRIPLLIMATIPLAFLGILPGFAFLDAIDGTFLTATTLIGFIALMGIVVNNAIIYLEYLEILIQEKGMKLTDALVEAARVRLRPILLTSLTTIFGSLTIASDPVWSGLAWAIIFGLSLSALLTLGVFPILYLKFEGRKK